MLQPEKETSPSPKPAICLPPPTPAVSHLLLWPSVRRFPSCNRRAQCPVYFYITFSYGSPCVFFSSRCVKVFFQDATKPREHSFVHTHTTARAHTQHSYTVSSSQGKKGYTFTHSQIFPAKNTARYLSARTDCCSLQVCETGGDTEVVSTPFLSIGFIVLAQTH